MIELRMDSVMTTSNKNEFISPEDAQSLHEWLEEYKSLSEDQDKLTVAVMDTGIDKRRIRNHPWFEGSEFGNINFSGFDSKKPWVDEIGHGTGVASIIARNTPGIELISVKIFSTQGSTTYKIIEDAYEFLIDNSDEIDIVNMSWGSNRDTPELNALHEELIQNDVHDVVAAGNCLPANTWVLTSDGYKRMHNIYKMGQGTKVLSYDEKQGFIENEVTQTYKREIKSDEKILRAKTDEGHVLELTGNHKVLTSKGYVRAKNLVKGDEIITKPDSNKKVPDFYGNENPSEKGVDHAKGDHPSGDDHVQYKERIEVSCPNCGSTKELVPHRAKKEKGFCSNKCSSEYHGLNPSELSSEEAKEYMPDNLPEIGKKALKEWREKNPEQAKFLKENEEFIEEQGDPSKLPHTKEIARMGALASHEVQRKKGEKTTIENKLSEILDDIGVKYEEEYLVEKGKTNQMLTSVDFAIPERKIAIYADGNYWHNYPEGTEIDEQITNKLRERGWEVFRYWGSEIKNDTEKVKEKLVTSISNGATVIEMEEIESKTVYDISVKDPHNFVANGLVVHNSGSDGGSPATAGRAFSAGALDKNGKPTRFSSFDPDKGNPDVAAVGKNVKMVRAKGTEMGVPLSEEFVKASGTSFAAPYTVAAYVNALYRKRESWDKRLMEVAPDIPGTPKDGGGVLKLSPLFKDPSELENVSTGKSWNFQGRDLLWINSDWLPEKEVTIRKQSESDDSITLKVEFE